jgi:hypothetical protein
MCVLERPRPFRVSENSLTDPQGSLVLGQQEVLGGGL